MDKLTQVSITLLGIIELVGTISFGCDLFDE